MKTPKFFISILLSLCVVLGLYKSPALADTTTNKLTLKTKSYTYNAKGQRTGNKSIKKGAKVKFVGKIQKTNKVRNYYIFKNPLPNGIDNPIKENLYWLPYKKIKGKLYYKLATNKYIRCINVEKINQYYVYVPQSTVIVDDPARSAQKHIYAQDETGYFTSHVLKTGSKLIVDKVAGLRHSQAAESYRIKGTNLYIYAGDIVKRPHGLIKQVEMNNKSAFITLNKNVHLYNENGDLKEPKDRVLQYKGSPDKYIFKVDKLEYIWQPQENTAELFYHLTNDQEVYTYTPDSNLAQPAKTKTKDDYIEVEDTNFIQGLKLETTNTPEEAKAIYEASQN